ncbi:hypothetical protein SAMN06265348_103442 [Pedobacter westerhofensis]|uniref:Uncharacterized protein n=1 Tax=Pedobacter westerhofensis TaxID=425512 RepID=A0A521CCC9_9SPHI|nr:hypothetical protein SAMN06265348_103442 [Pedobacter westerhofensis]
MLGNYEDKFTQKKSNAPKQLNNKMLKQLKINTLAYF